MSLHNQAKKIVEQREKVYGKDRHAQFTRLAEVWTTILRQACPAFAVCTPPITAQQAAVMCAAAKLLRAVMSEQETVADHYLDGINYLDFAYEVALQDLAEEEEEEPADESELGSDYDVEPAWQHEPNPSSQATGAPPLPGELKRS